MKNSAGMISCHPRLSKVALMSRKGPPYVNYDLKQDIKEWVTAGQTGASVATLAP